MNDDRDDEPAAAHPAWPGLLPWQHDAADALLASRERWPHALLLTGAAGIGKRQLAFELGRALLCESPRPDGHACGACPGCHYVAVGQHPDIRIVEPIEVDDDGVAKPVEWIAVKHIRALTAWAQLTSHRRVAKVAVIVPAERMNTEAANALLKTLEEPPAGTFLMLVSAAPGRIPATVRSRCRRMVAPWPDTAAARMWLAAQDVPNPEALLAQAAGAPLAALALADPAYQAERAIWLSRLATPRTLVPAQLAARIDAAPREDRRNLMAAAIDWMHGWCVDLAVVQTGGMPRRNADYAPALGRLGAAVAPLPLFRYHRTLLRQRSLAAHPLQPRLVAEALLTDYRSLFP